MHAQHLPLPLLHARVHEVCGPGAMGFAAVACAQSRGHLLWTREGWAPDRIAPPGLLEFCDPARLLMVQAGNRIDTLAIAEEALKDGVIALVVIEVTRPVNLREGRRLQLAAKAGRTTGLCLIPEGAGSPAAETRWHCAPVFYPQGTEHDSTHMRWEITKNKEGTLGVWHVRWDSAAHRLDVVSPVAQRPGSAPAPG